MTTFKATVTADERVLIAWRGRTVVTVVGAKGRRLVSALASAVDEEARQLLLARATGNFKRGNEP